jgi:hypothetical protein
MVSTYIVTAAPLNLATTGQSGFFTDQFGMSRDNKTGTAGTVAVLAVPNRPSH